MRKRFLVRSKKSIFKILSAIVIVLTILILPVGTSEKTAGKKKNVVLVAGRPSHGHGQHEHNAGVLLLKSCLDQLPDVQATAFLNGWPKDTNALDQADTILFYADGGNGNLMIQENRLQFLGQKMKQGVGLVVLHYAVEVPKDHGGAEFMDWIGGYYETGVSTNPVWTAEFKSIPDHPVTRGINPFTIQDEWYFNIHFRPEMKGVIPLFKATPPDAVRGTESAKAYPGREEVVSWCVERPDGGRGFGYTGGHFHENWGNPNTRTLILNAIYWTAHLEVQAGGVPSTVTPEDLEKNMDKK